MKKIIEISFVFLVLVSSQAGAQSVADSTGGKDKMQFKAGVFYISHLNYYGRTDSLRSSGFFPVAEVWFNKHLYVTAAPVFVINTADQFDYAGTVAIAGYRFGKENKSAGNIFFVKPFYKDNSQLVQSALKAQVAGTGSWLNKVINITGGADVKFSDQVDFGLSAGLDHIFRFELDGPSVLVIDPTAYVHAGTQQFTKTYYKQSSFLLFPGIQQQVTEEVKNFNILSYEFSVPIIYAKGKFQLLATPAYVMPQNLVTVTNRPDLSERGRNMFYATVGTKLTF